MNTLLRELLTEGKRKKIAKVAPADDVPDSAKNNFAAKHSVNKSGAGPHVDKNGPKAPRNRQKRDWKKDAKNDY